MKPIPKPEDDGVIEFSCHLAMAANYSVVGDHNHAEPELRLLLDLANAVKKYRSDPDAYDHELEAAVAAITENAPHLWDAARKARP